MHQLLEQLLKKRGIKDVADLTNEEANTYDKWDKTLSGNELTLEKLEMFVNEQVRNIQEQFINPDNSDKRDDYLKACLNVYLTLGKILKAPQVERETLEKYLRSLI